VEGVIWIISNVIEQAVIRATQRCLTVLPYCLRVVLLIVTAMLWTNQIKSNNITC